MTLYGFIDVSFCRHDFNIAVLKAFVNLSDFAGMILVQALRSVYVLSCTKSLLIFCVLCTWLTTSMYESISSIGVMSN